MLSRSALAWWVLAVLMGTLPAIARAECSTSIQCIGISANSPEEAEHNHHGGVAGQPGTTPGSVLVVMDFSNQPVAGTTTKTLYVAAAQGPVGAVVQLDPIRLSGPDANQFTLTGGTCALNGGPGPTHSTSVDGTRFCTIEVTFRPTSPGAKTALLTVPFPQPIAGFIDHRDATLTGIGGDERVSPLADAQVSALIGSQVASLQKFGAAQIANVTDRLASLRRIGTSRSADRALAGGLADRGGMRGQTLTFRPQASGSATPADAAPRTGAGDDAAPWPAQALASLLTTRQVRLNAASDAGTQGSAPGAAYWVGGTATFGRMGQDVGEYRFETTGLSAGADMRVNGDLVLGAAAGYSQLHSEFGSAGSESKNTGQSLSLYGSYQLGADVYVDAIVGWGTLKSRSNRFVTAASAYASSDRRGSQLFGSLALSQAFHEENLWWEPFARVEFASGQLDRADETGVGISALTYQEQKLRSSRLALGLRTSARHELSFGQVTPQLRLEYGYELNRVGAATINYADQPGGPTYTVAPTVGQRGSAVVGLGAELLTHGGLAFGFELSSNGRVSRNPEYSTRLWLATTLEDRRQRPADADAPTSKTPLIVTAGYRYDNNITRTGTPTTPLGDHIWSVGIGTEHLVEFSESLGLALGGQLMNEKYGRYEGLDNNTLGVRADLAYQAGGHFAAPRFAGFVNLTYDASRSELRTGYRGEAGLSVRVPVAERTGLSALLSHTTRRSKSDVFDTNFSTARVAGDQQVGERGSFRMAVEARQGDFVSSGRSMADSAAISEALADDDALAEKRFVAYRFPGKSWMATLGYNRQLGPRDAFDLSWSALRVRPTKAPDYTWFQFYPTMGLPGTGGNSPYSVQQVDISYTMRF